MPLDGRIPADVTKNDMEHRVPLSPAAVEVIRGQLEARRRMTEEAKKEGRRRLIEAVPYVFWGGRVARDGTITKLSGRTRFRERWRNAVDDARREVDEDLPPMPDWTLTICAGPPSPAWLGSAFLSMWPRSS